MANSWTQIIYLYVLGTLYAMFNKRALISKFLRTDTHKFLGMSILTLLTWKGQKL